jgi:hypothetical protein
MPPPSPVGAADGANSQRRHLSRKARQAPELLVDTQSNTEAHLCANLGSTDHAFPSGSGWADKDPT